MDDGKGEAKVKRSGEQQQRRSRVQGSGRVQLEEVRQGQVRVQVCYENLRTGGELLTGTLQCDK